MSREKRLKEILNNEELQKKYLISDISNLKITGPYSNKLIEILSVVVMEKDNNLSNSQIYSKIKNIHKIG